MISATGLRRAGWLGALGLSLLTAGPLAAQAPPPAIPGTNHATKYKLDMRLAPVPKVVDEQLDLKGEGVLVVQVRPEGPAAKAGIKVHDIVLAVGDAPIKGPSDLIDAVDKSDGKELSLKLMRAGKPITVTMTPEKSPEGTAGPGRLRIEVTQDIRDLENKIRDRLKEAGGDMRMEFFQPGRLPPPGMRLGAWRRPEFPDDLSVTIHKQGKNPAEIEAKQGDQTWNVKENDLAQLPDEVRKHVEGLLGHGPLAWNINYNVSDNAADGPPHDGPGAPPRARRGPPRPDGPQRPDGPPPRPEDGRHAGRPGGHDGPDGPPRPHGPPRPEDGPHAGPPGGPDGPGDGPRARRPGGPDGPPHAGPDDRGRHARGGLEHRLSEMSREMHRMHQQIEDLRRSLHEDGDGNDEEEEENEEYVLPPQ